MKIYLLRKTKLSLLKSKPFSVIREIGLTCFLDQRMISLEKIRPIAVSLKKTALIKNISIVGRFFNPTIFFYFMYSKHVSVKAPNNATLCDLSNPRQSFNETIRPNSIFSRYTE